MRICCATASVWPDGSPCCTRGLAGARLRPSAGRLARRHEDASLAANVAQPGLTHPLDLSISDPLRRATTEGVLPMEMAHLMTDTVFYSIPNADRVMYVHHAVMFYCHMAMGSVAGTRCFGLDDGPPGIDGVRLLSLAGFVAEVPGPLMAFRWVMMKKGWHVRFPVWFFVNNGVMLVGWIGSRIVWFFYVFWFMLLPVKDAYISAGAGDVSVPPPRHLQRHRACGCAVVQWGLAGGDRHEAASQWSFAAVPRPYQAHTKPVPSPYQASSTSPTPIPQRPLSSLTSGVADLVDDGGRLRCDMRLVDRMGPAAAKGGAAGLSDPQPECQIDPENDPQGRRRR